MPGRKRKWRTMTSALRGFRSTRGAVIGALLMLVALAVPAGTSEELPHPSDEPTIAAGTTGEPAGPPDEFTGAPHGDTGTVNQLTLGEAVEMAVKNAPRLEELSSLMRAGEAGERLARAGRMPDMDLTGRYSRYSNVPEYAVTQPDGSREVIFPNIPNRYYARLGLAVPVYSGGRIAAGVSAAERRIEAANADLQTATADIRQETADAYLTALLAEAQEQVLAESIESFDAHLSDVRNRMNFGLAAQNDLLAVQVERDQAELARLQADGTRAVAMANLARLLDLPPGARIETVERLDPLDDQLPELRSLVAQAMGNRSEQTALTARIAAAEAVVELERSALKPTVSAAAGFDYARYNPLIIPPVDEFNDSWDISLFLSYRFYDGGKRKESIAMAREEAESLTHRLEDLERAIRQQVTARYHELQTAQAAVPVAAEGLVSAEENLRVSRDRYREGLIPSSQLLDAEVALTQAGLNRTSALVRFRLAETNLARAVGEHAAK